MATKSKRGLGVGKCGVSSVQWESWLTVDTEWPMLIWPVMVVNWAPPMCPVPYGLAPATHLYATTLCTLYRESLTLLDLKLLFSLRYTTFQGDLQQSFTFFDWFRFQKTLEKAPGCNMFLQNMSIIVFSTVQLL